MLAMRSNKYFMWSTLGVSGITRVDLMLLHMMVLSHWLPEEIRHQVTNTHREGLTCEWLHSPIDL